MTMGGYTKMAEQDYQAILKELRQQLKNAERERDEALRLLYDQMGGPNPSTLVPAVKLIIANARRTQELSINVAAERNCLRQQVRSLRDELSDLLGDFKDYTPWEDTRSKAHRIVQHVDAILVAPKESPKCSTAREILE